jgi:hypothetical protein
VWLKNQSDYPETEVRRLVEFAVRDVDMRDVFVRLRNIRDTRRRGPYRGRAYRGVPEISSAPAAAAYLVTLHLGPPGVFPLPPHRPTRRSPEIELASWQEALVAVAAHEAAHVDQYRRGLPVSEVACNVHAARVLAAFRDEHPHHQQLVL